MIKKKNIWALTAVMGLAAISALPVRAASTDYAQDVAITSDPSPRDIITGSSINQFGRKQTNSQIDNYVNQDEQINLTEKSGTIRVLRTNQKSGLNNYVTAMIPLNNVNPRELRGLARTICRKEGGDADLLQDKVNKQNYMIVVCPEFQLPYLTKTLQAIDHKWMKEVETGSWVYYYEGKNRDVRDMMQILQLYRTPDGVWVFDDANNAVLFEDQPCIQGLFNWGTETVDISPNQLSLEVAIYEVDVRNDLVLGLDWEALKNGPNQNLFEFIFWNYGEDDPLNLFPGSPQAFSDHGRMRSYNVTASTAYLDFLESKGKARLVTKSMISAKSGTVGELAAVDEVLSFQSSANTTAQTITRPVPLNVANVFAYYNELGMTAMSTSALLELSATEIVSEIEQFLTNVVKAGESSVKIIVEDLQEKAKDGVIDIGDISSSQVPPEISLIVFRERSLQYVKSGRVGVLLTVLPVVGQESAETVVSLDVTDVHDLTPAGTPIIEHRYFSSVVQLGNGQPTVLGGIKRTVNVQTASGIPFLRDIPWIGYAFGREVTTKRERNLVVVMTPRFNLCPTSMVDAPEEFRTAISLAKGEDVLQVPDTAFGFDKWLLDAEKTAVETSAAE